MTDFWFGCLCGVVGWWFVVAAISLTTDTLRRRDGERFWLFLCLPVVLIAFPFLFIWYGLFYGPWHNVVNPISQKRWKRWCEYPSAGKKLRITKRFYLCWEPEAPNWYNRLFFVRIEKER